MMKVLKCYFLKSFLVNICWFLINREGWSVVYVIIKFFEKDMLYDNIEIKNNLNF